MHLYKHTVHIRTCNMYNFFSFGSNFSNVCSSRVKVGHRRAILFATIKSLIFFSLFLDTVALLVAFIPSEDGIDAGENISPSHLTTRKIHWLTMNSILHQECSFMHHESVLSRHCLENMQDSCGCVYLSPLYRPHWAPIHPIALCTDLLSHLALDRLCFENGPVFDKKNGCVTSWPGENLTGFSCVTVDWPWSNKCPKYSTAHSHGRSCSLVQKISQCRMSRLFSF